MKLKKMVENIVCDVPGCNNVAICFIGKNGRPEDSVKLCANCLKEIGDELDTIKVKNGKN